MKWIGQHIWDYISRFRNDVYLEDISTGTIASGGNLGLDSNNKIVKADTEAGELSFSGSTADGVLTYGDSTTINVESYLTFTNSGNISRMEFLSNQDTGDKFQISTTTHGATTLATFDDDAMAADLTFAPDGDAIFNLVDSSPTSLFKINLVGANNHMLEVTGEAGNTGSFKMYEMGGDSTDDYFTIGVSEHGATNITTLDASGAQAGIVLEPDGDLNLYPGTGDTTFLSSTSAKPSVKLRNSNTDAVAPELVFQKTTNGTDGDDLGSILFKGDDVAGNIETYAQILGEIAESADGDEEGKLTLLVASHDAELQPGLIIASGDAEDEVDVTIGNGAASVTTAAGALESTGKITILGGQYLYFNDNDNSHSTRIAHSTGATNRTFTLPDATGTAALQETLGWNGSQTRIKILHSDFIADDGGRPVMIDDAAVGAEKLFLKTNSTNTAYATIAIPTGFDATHVMVYGFGTPAVEVWEHSITDKAGVSKGTGNVGTEIDITDVTSSTTNYLFIQVAQGASDEIYGGYVTIAAT